MSLVRWIELARASSSTAALVALVAFNLLPLVGVLFLDWDLLSILVLYWLESGVVGLLNVPKMLLAARYGPTDPTAAATASALPAGSRALAGGCLVPFFLFHYGMFWFVHGIFVFLLPAFAVIGGGTVGGGVSPFGAQGVDLRIVVPGALALAASHVVSFVYNFLGRKEYLNTTVSAQMMAPYGRVVVLHVTILGGAFLVAALGTPVAALAVMVALKTAIDLGLHLRERRKAGTIGSTVS